MVTWKINDRACKVNIKSSSRQSPVSILASAIGGLQQLRACSFRPAQGPITTTNAGFPAGLDIEEKIRAVFVDRRNPPIVVGMTLTQCPQWYPVYSAHRRFLLNRRISHRRWLALEMLTISTPIRSRNQRSVARWWDSSAWTREPVMSSSIAQNGKALS